MTTAGESHNSVNALMLPLFIAFMASLTVLIASLEGDAEQIAGVAESARAAVRVQPANR
jgi:hypothetical protein